MPTKVSPCPRCESRNTTVTIPKDIHRDPYGLCNSCQKAFVLKPPENKELTSFCESIKDLSDEELQKKFNLSDQVVEYANYLEEQYKKEAKGIKFRYLFVHLFPSQYAVKRGLKNYAGKGWKVVDQVTSSSLEEIKSVYESLKEKGLVI